MEKQVPIAEAKNKLTVMIREVEAGPAIQLTRRGKPVAVLLSTREYHSLCRRKRDLGDAIDRFRKDLEAEQIAITEDDLAGLRDRSPGRPVDF